MKLLRNLDRMCGKLARRLIPISLEVMAAALLDIVSRSQWQISLRYRLGNWMSQNHNFCLEGTCSA